MLDVRNLLWSCPVAVFVRLEFVDGPCYLRLLFVSRISSLPRLSPGGVSTSVGCTLINLQSSQPTDPPRRSRSLLSPILRLAHCSTELTASLSVSPSSVLSVGFLLPTLTFDPDPATWVGVWPLLPQKKSTCCVSFCQLSS